MKDPSIVYMGMNEPFVKGLTQIYFNKGIPISKKALSLRDPRYADKVF